MEIFKPENNKKNPPEKVLKEKLFVLKNLEGEYDEKPSAIVRELDMDFENEDGYVGFIIFGSSVEGYYSKEDSDLDLYYMYDSSLLQKKSSKDSSEKKYFKGLKEMVIGRTQKAEEKYGKNVRVANWFFSDINSEKIISNLQSQDERIAKSSIKRLAELAGLSVGKKIENYRKIYASYLQQLSREEQEKIKEGIIEFKTYQSEKAHEKRIKRNSEFSQESQNDLINSRRDLWTKRVENIYGI